MLTILLHSSKTMRPSPSRPSHGGTLPLLQDRATELARYLKTLSVAELMTCMAISEDMAQKTRSLINAWGDTSPSLPAIDAFLGDIYSGLQVQTFNEKDRVYAQEHLYILSGLYGVLRALDLIQPYRLEMGYKLPKIPLGSAQTTSSLYAYWGDAIAQCLPRNQTIINLSAAEYTKAVFPHFKKLEGFKEMKIVSPKFLTVSPKTGEPTFVTVHAKIARGAFAHWLIVHRVQTIEQLKEFQDLGYQYDPARSTEDTPVFVAEEFKGLGLSVRLLYPHS